MSPPPLRVDMNARRRPSGENNGRRSVASWETSKRASPPVDGTDQISPPAAKAISEPSGETPGSAAANSGDAPCACAPALTGASQQHRTTIEAKEKKRAMAGTLQQGK